MAEPDPTTEGGSAAGPTSASEQYLSTTDHLSLTFLSSSSRFLQQSPRTGLAIPDCSSSHNFMLTPDLGNRSQFADELSAAESVSGSPDSDPKDWQQTSHPVHAGGEFQPGGTLHRPVPLRTSPVLRDGADHAWNRSAVGSYPQAGSETRAAVPGNLPNENDFDGAPPSRELTFKPCKCQNSNDPAAKTSHALCKASGPAEREEASSKKKSSDQNARNYFINVLLLDYLTVVAKTIHPTFVDSFLRALEECNLDLDHVMELRKSGVCLKPLAQILNKCIQKALTSDASEKNEIRMDDDNDDVGDDDEKHSDDIDGDAGDIQHTRNEVPHQTHSPHQMTFNPPQQAWAKEGTSFPKQPEHKARALSPLPDTVMQGNSIDSTCVTRNATCDVTSSGLTDQNTSYLHKDSQKVTMDRRPFLMGSPFVESGMHTNTDKAQCPKTEATDFSLQKENGSKTTGQNSNSSSEDAKVPEATAEVLSDRGKAVKRKAEEEPMAVEANGEDPYLELSLRVPEDDDNVQMTQGGVTLVLLRSRMWRTFAEVGTEMIINRSGRRMFPFVSVELRGLEERSLYEVEMEMVAADTRRYKFISNTWTAVGVADAACRNRPYSHPESPNTGLHWMGREVHFTRVKLTNNKESSEGNMLLQSMHKYVVQITVNHVQDAFSRKRLLRSFHFRLDLTSFFAVTAYQNDLVTKLKIHNNPFAKAFRDSSFSVITHKKETENRRPHYYGDDEGQTVTETTGKKREARAPGHTDLPAVPAALGGTLPHVLEGLRYPLPQTGTPRMSLPHAAPMMWMPPAWMGMGQGGMVHPYFYSLARPDTAPLWGPHHHHHHPSS